MSKKKTKKAVGARIVKPNSENYTFVNQQHTPSNSLHEEKHESESAKKIEKFRHSSRDVKFHYKSKKIHTNQGHSSVYE